MSAHLTVKGKAAILGFQPCETLQEIISRGSE